MSSRTEWGRPISSKSGIALLDQAQRDRGQAPLEEHVATEAVGAEREGEVDVTVDPQLREVLLVEQVAEELGHHRVVDDGRSWTGRIAPSTRTSGGDPIDRARSVPLASTTACRAAPSAAWISIRGQL